jgi:glycine/D-amino acid oxidase-like deaminating enzyme
MDIHSGFPFWLVKNGLLADFPKLTENLYQEEVVIIGSGISGALAAHELCNAGFKCTMLDKRILTSGSTWASTAQMNYEIDSSMVQLTDTYSEEFAVGVYEASLQSVESLQKALEDAEVYSCIEPKCSLYLASDRKGVKDIEAEYKMRRKHNFPVDLLDAGQLETTYGIRRERALYHEHAAQMDAYRAAVGLILYHVTKHELKVYTRTMVTGLQAEKDSVLLQTEDGHQIRSRFVVCAPGYESESFLPEKIMALHSTYALVTQPLADEYFWKDRCLIWESARPYFYLRNTSDNRIMMGGKDIKFKNAKLRDALMEKKARDLLKECNSLFPQIPVDAEFCWCGTFGETKDGLPYIGEHPDLKNVYFALGYGGNGTTFSMIAAQIIRNHLTGKPDKRQKLFSFER